jgi:hypothetical protein
MLAMTALAQASPPTVADLDAQARASGNRKEIAQHIGQALFLSKWPAQVTKISADSVDDHVVVGVRVSGVHFHTPLTRDSFAQEVAALVTGAFSNAPVVNEVDVWVSVPLDVGKGVIVSGDLAKPTTRTVFTLTAQRGESAASLVARMRSGSGVYWDEDWARTLLKQGLNAS